MKKRIIDDEFLSRMEALTVELLTPMQGYFGGAHRTKLYGSTVEFADFREYVPGDDIRRIDWNLYSRFEKHFIKLFVDERQMHTRIYLDGSASMKGADSEKIAYALRVTAALGYLSVRSMDKVSFGLMRGKDMQDLCGQVSGMDAYYHAVDRLERVTCGGETDIREAISGCRDPGYDDGLTVIISDFLTDSDFRAAVDYLLYRHRQVMLLQILTPEEMAPAYSGRVFLRDCETQDISDMRNMKMRMSATTVKAYREALDEYIREIRGFCSARGVDFITAVTDEPVEKLIFEGLYESGVIK